MQKYKAPVQPIPSYHMSKNLLFILKFILLPCLSAVCMSERCMHVHTPLEEDGSSDRGTFKSWAAL